MTADNYQILTIDNRLLATPEAFDDLAEQLTATEIDALKQCHQWIATFLIQVMNKGPDKVEAICPFVQASLESGQMLFSIARPNDPNNPDDIYNELMTYAKIFVDREPKEYPKCIHKCVVPVFPQTPGHLITNAIVQHTAREDLIAMGIMVGDASPDREFEASWNPEFNPMQSPFPLYALRSFIPTDWRFIKNSEKLRQLYKQRFGEPKAGDEFLTPKGRLKALIRKVKSKIKSLIQP